MHFNFASNGDLIWVTRVNVPACRYISLTVQVSCYACCVAGSRRTAISSTTQNEEDSEPHLSESNSKIKSFSSLNGESNSWFIRHRYLAETATIWKGICMLWCIDAVILTLTGISDGCDNFQFGNTFNVVIGNFGESLELLLFVLFLCRRSVKNFGYCNSYVVSSYPPAA